MCYPHHSATISTEGLDELVEEVTHFQNESQEIQGGGNGYKMEVQKSKYSYKYH